MDHIHRAISPEELQQTVERVASDIATAIERPVTIRHGANSVVNGAFQGQPIVISVDPARLEHVRNTEQFVRLYTGLSYREAYHLLAQDGDSLYLKAKALGVEHIFNVLFDERVIRQTTAANSKSGPYLQSVESFLYPTSGKNGSTIEEQTVGGKTIDAPAQGTVGAIAQYAERFNQFAYHFRRPEIPLSATAEPLVAEALAMVSANLKDESADDLLAAARRIQEKLSQGIEVEVMEPATSEAEQTNATGEAPARPLAQEGLLEKLRNWAANDEPAEIAPVTGKQRARWYHNKHVTVAAAIFASIWTGIFAKFGVQFWLVMALLTSLGCGGAVGAVVIYRARIAEMLMNFLNSIGRKVGSFCSAIDDWRRRPVIRILLRGLACVLAAAVLALAAYKLFDYLFNLTAFLFLVPVAGILSLITLVCRDKDSPVDHARHVRFARGVMPFLCMMIGAGLFEALRTLGASFLFAILAAILAFAVNLVTVLIVVPAAIGAADYSAGHIRRFLAALKDVLDSILDLIVSIGRVAKKTGIAIATGVVALICLMQALAQKLAWRFEPNVAQLWSYMTVRIAVLSSAPVAMGMMLFSVLATAGKTSWPVAIILFVMMASMVMMAIIFRKQLVRMIVNEGLETLAEIAGFDETVLPLDMETTQYPSFEEVCSVDADAMRLAQLEPEVEQLAQQMRNPLNLIGQRTIEREYQRTGRVGEGAYRVMMGDLAIKQDGETAPRSSVDLQVLLDCSTSNMLASCQLGRGEKFRRGQIMALSLEKAMVGLANLSAHFWGYVDTILYDCGQPGEQRLSGLICRGGNNDTAALEKARAASLASGKEIKIIIMINDAQPDQASFRSLRDLAADCQSRDGIIVWQMVLDDKNVPAMNSIVTNLCKQSLSQAAVEVAQTLEAISLEIAA